MDNNNEKLHSYKQEALSAAKDLLYPRPVIQQIRCAGSVAEITRIMVDARNKYL